VFDPRTVRALFFTQQCFFALFFTLILDLPITWLICFSIQFPFLFLGLPFQLIPSTAEQKILFSATMSSVLFTVAILFSGQLPPKFINIIDFFTDVQFHESYHIKPQTTMQYVPFFLFRKYITQGSWYSLSEILGTYALFLVFQFCLCFLFSLVIHTIFFNLMFPFYEHPGEIGILNVLV
jgi:hypothetical protein